MEKKQTAVEWMVLKMTSGNIFSFEVVIEKAKQMEKEQIKDAFVECWKSNVSEGIECKLSAEEYYNETYVTC